MKEFLFFYGTLQPDLAPAEIAPLVHDFCCLGRGSIRGALYDLGEYPGAVLDPPETKIWGQVFVLPQDPEVLSRLDAYEEFNPSDRASSQFVRTKCECTLESGNEITVWVYFYNRDPGSAERIADGDFRKSRLL